jgi:hypothetical protein
MPAIKTANTFRLFISSTFSDFAAEREALQQRVFPELEKFFAERGARFQPVDLRWGIRVEEAERGEVLPICLAESDRSRPYFIGMLGESYGWIPPRA